MVDGKDAVARDARITRLGPEFRWPGGRHVAVVFNVAFEAWSDGKAPGIGPMGNPLPGAAFDTNALSWGHYGAVRGIDRLLRTLDRVKLRRQRSQAFPGVIVSIRPTNPRLESACRICCSGTGRSATSCCGR